MKRIFMAKPNIFISHRWLYGEDYYNLTKKLKEYRLDFLNYSVPEHDPLDRARVEKIKEELGNQVKQCNYFLIFANMAIANSSWIEHEIKVAQAYNKPILAIKPFGYTGNIPKIIQEADSESGPVGFNTPSIIRKICTKLGHPSPL